VERIFCLAALVALAGCSLAPAVSNFTVSYNGSIEEVNNQLLLANILRARDRAPLYFSDLSQIRGALTLSASTAVTIPFGPQKVLTTKEYTDLATAGISSSPTFDIVPLNEQVFTQGIVQPLELQYGKLYWDRVDYSEFLLAMLFVDKIEVGYSDAQGRPLPQSDGDGNPVRGPDGQPIMGAHIVFNIPDDPTKLGYFRREIMNWGVDPENPRWVRAISYHGYKALTPIAESVTLGAQGGLKDLVSLDPHKFRAKRMTSSQERDASSGANAKKNLPGRKPVAKGDDLYQLYSIEDRIIICPPKPFLERWSRTYDILIVAPQIVGNTIDVTPQSAAACDASEWPGEDALPPSAKKRMTITIYTRSVEGMIQYLGAILRPGSENPLRFIVTKGSSESAKVALSYAGDQYSVAPYARDPADTLGTDNTLPILALVEQLLNLRKNSKEITTTPAAQIVP
jgi:hypothetical protein